jgi:hypothetical protein
MSALVLWPNAHRQRAALEVLSRGSCSLEDLAAELGVSQDDAGHILRRLQRPGLDVDVLDGFEPEPPLYRLRFVAGRVCAEEGCGTVLRTTNPSDRCELHGGGFLEHAQVPVNVPRIDGSALRVLREREGLTVRELAARVELDPGFVSKLELGRRPVSPAIAARLAGALGTTVLRR